MRDGAPRANLGARSSHSVKGARNVNGHRGPSRGLEPVCYRPDQMRIADAFFRSEFARVTEVPSMHSKATG